METKENRLSHLPQTVPAPECMIHVVLRILATSAMTRTKATFTTKIRGSAMSEQQ